MRKHLEPQAKTEEADSIACFSQLGTQFQIQRRPCHGRHFLGGGTYEGVVGKHGEK